jgi:hypothetical protein
VNSIDTIKLELRRLLQDFKVQADAFALYNPEENVYVETELHTATVAREGLRDTYLRLSQCLFPLICQDVHFREDFEKLLSAYGTAYQNVGILKNKMFVACSECQYELTLSEKTHCIKQYPFSPDSDYGWSILHRALGCSKGVNKRARSQAQVEIGSTTGNETEG